MRLTSTAFGHGDRIPVECSGDGANRSPPLAWTGVPSRARSLALIVDDRDSLRWRWVHWVIYDIPIYAGGTVWGQPPGGARVGTNDWGHAWWNGPCPRFGVHHYAFTLYAIDRELGDRGAITRLELERAIDG